MRSARAQKIVTPTLALVLAAFCGCSSGSGNTTAVGSGGAAGSGGAPGAGGAPGNDGGSGGATDAAIESPPANCPAVASTWVGKYEITRLVVRYSADSFPPYGGRTITYTRAGTRDERGDTFALKEGSHVDLEADGTIKAGYVATRNGVSDYAFDEYGQWMKEGASTLVADYQGDSLYRRKFAVTVEGCVLKGVKTFPPDGQPGPRSEHNEVDLLRR